MNDQSRIVCHPFKPFVPRGCTSLLLGSFPGSHSTGREPLEDDWYYSAAGNQFWPIMEELFPERELKTTMEKKQLFVDLHMALADVILSCERRNGSNQDRNLIHRVYNIEGVERILLENPLEKILFTGKGVNRVFEKRFRCLYPVEMIVLPSPSPAFFRMSFERKTDEWRRVFSAAGLLKTCQQPPVELHDSR